MSAGAHLMLTKHVFISYADEDHAVAKRLSGELEKRGLNTWLDKESLLAGQNWEREIISAVKKSTYFIPLLSFTSVRKRGFVQKEFLLALDIVDKLPEDQIFVIPVRLNDCEVPYEKLRKYHCVDLFPIWENGIKNIFRAMAGRRGSLEDLMRQGFKLGGEAKRWMDEGPKDSGSEKILLAASYIFLTRVYQVDQSNPKVLEALYHLAVINWGVRSPPNLERVTDLYRRFLSAWKASPYIRNEITKFTGYDPVVICQDILSDQSHPLHT
jgi:hypothetical protein